MNVMLSHPAVLPFTMAVERDHGFTSTQHAFNAVRRVERHRRYLGRKPDCVPFITVETLHEAKILALTLLLEGDQRFSRADGPCGCITIRTGRFAFLFFGHAAGTYTI